MKSSLICADDFLLTKQISLGIIKLIEKNKINSVSSMVIFKKNIKYGYLLKKKIKPTQIIGLHLVLTHFKPLSKFKQIKVFPGIFELYLNIIFNKILIYEIENEIKSQILEFKKIFGYLPKYIDGHHHVHQIPIITNILIRVVNEIYQDKKPVVRNTSLNISLILSNNISVVKTSILSVFGYFLKKKLKKNLIPTNDFFFGIYNFKNIKQFKKNYYLFEKYKKKKSILMTHPSLKDSEISNLDTLTDQRFIEYQALLGELKSSF